MPWQSSESLVWPWKLGPLFIHVSACRCEAEMRNRAPGGSEGCTSNEETQAIFSLRDRLTSRFALQWGVISILSGAGTLRYPPECDAYTRWRLSHRCAPSGGETEPCCLCCSLRLQSSECCKVSGEHLASLKQPGTVGVWSRIACSSFSSLPPLFDFVLPALHRGSHGEAKGKGEEKESCSSSHLCQALRLSSSGSLLCLHCFPRRLKLQLPGARRYRWGGSAYDVLIIRFAITWGREADLLLLSKWRKRE